MGWDIKVHIRSWCNQDIAPNLNTSYYNCICSYPHFICYCRTTFTNASLFFSKLLTSSFPFQKTILWTGRVFPPPNVFYLLLALSSCDPSINTFSYCSQILSHVYSSATRFLALRPISAISASLI